MAPAGNTPGSPEKPAPPAAPRGTRRPRVPEGLRVFVVLLLLAWAGYAAVLLKPGTVLAFNDNSIESALSPLFPWPRPMLRVWDNQFFFGTGARQYPLSFHALGETLAGPYRFRREFMGVVLAAAGLGVYWMLRQHRFGHRPSFFCAAATMLAAASFHYAMVGLPARPVALGCAAAALGLAERGRRARRLLPYVLGGGVLGLGVAEVPDVGALYAVAAGAVLVFTHAAGPDRRPRARAYRALMLAAFVAASGAVSYQAVHNVLATNVQGVTQGADDDPAARYAWATQWSLPKAETWSMVSGTYFGSTMHSARAPYWGRVGRDAQWDQAGQGFRNFTLTGWGMGAVPALLLLALVPVAASGALGAGTGRRPLAWMAAAGCAGALALSWGKYFPAYRLLYALPFFSTMRNPEKWNGPFTLFAAFGLAIVVEQLLACLDGPRDERARRRTRTALLASAAVLGAVAAAVLLGTGSGRAAFVERLAGEGYAEAAVAAWRHALAVSWKVLLLAGAFAALAAAALAPRRPGPALRRLVLPALAALSLGDLLYTNAFYVSGHRFAQFLRPNALTDYLDAHRFEGRLKLLPPRHPLLNNLRLTQLMLKGYDLFEPISVARMPNDYAALFGALGRQPVRLWELGSLRFFLTLPGGIEQLEQLDGRRGRFAERLAAGVTIVNDSYVPTAHAPPDQRPLRLLEFAGALPVYRFVAQGRAVPDGEAGDRAALARLADPAFELAREVLLHGAAEDTAFAAGTARVAAANPVDAVVETESDGDGLLVRSVKYDPDWRVEIDGEPAELERANYLFQAVRVPAGRHRVAFSYRPSLAAFRVAAATRLALLGLLAVEIARRRTRGRAAADGDRA